MPDDPCDLGSIQLINWMNRKDVQVLVGGTCRSNTPPAMQTAAEDIVV
jgi:hypothetical protein